MMPGMNPRKMQQMMKKMGIQQHDIDAVEVIIRTADKNIIISNPSVAKVNMMGQESFQVSGNVSVEDVKPESSISEEDVKTVMEQANCSEEEARKALEDAGGDIAAAILAIESR